MYIAKMHTRYPEFHGTGYYNFIMDMDEDSFEAKIEEMSHDFSHQGTVKTRHKSIDAIVAKYPTKADLNNKYFKNDILRG